MTLANAIWSKRAAHDLKKAFCTIFIESAVFSRFEENIRPVWRFWELWRSKMRFGRNVLRVTWKEGFVQFSWKAHSFPVLKRIRGHDDFENFDDPKCDLAETCCAWPEMCVLYTFYRKRTVFPFWREFEASVTILRTLTLQIAIWRKKAAHDLKKAFCTIFIESAVFSRFEENIRPVWRFWELWRSKMRFGRNVLRVTWKERFVQFSWKAHCFPVLKRIWSPRDNFENFDAPKCDLAETSCAWSEKCVLYNLVWRAHCFSVLKRIWGQFHDFENFDSQKCHLAKTCSIWPEKSVLSIFLKSPLFSFFKENLRIVSRFRDLRRSKMQISQNGSAWPERTVLYNFHENRTVFPFWREFEASVTILRTMTLANAIWSKRGPHDLKKASCTIFIESAVFSRFEENIRPVWRFWELWRSKMRFGQNVLGMTWKERFVQFSWKAHCFPVLKRILGEFHDFENFDAPKCDLAKTCSVWPEKSVLYNFHEKPTVFPFWRQFEASVTILKTLRLQNAIWPKRAAHDLKSAFCTIFMTSALFSRFKEILRPLSRLWELWRSKMRFGQNVLRITWKERFVQFLWKAHSFPVLKRIRGHDDFENFDDPKCDLAETCCAWPEMCVLYTFYRKRTVFPFWREFEASVTILRTLTLQIAIWRKKAAHDLKRAFCTIFMESALLSRFEENFMPVWRFWELWRSQMRFGRNVLRITWLYNFHGKRTVFLCWRELEAMTILKTLTIQNAIWPKRAAHDLKCVFCTLFIESALFSRFEENLKPVWRFSELWRSKLRFGRNVLRMIWKVRFVQFSMKSALFFRFEENLRPVSRFWKLWLSKMQFGQNVLHMSWKERFVNFLEKSTVFIF